MELGADVKVYRNDEIDIPSIESMRPEKIVISPGPGTPDRAGISNEVIAKFAPSIPLLGVCLGQQCIGQVYGGFVGSAGEIMHGKTSLIYHDSKGIFKGIPNPIEAIRYHSLIVYEKDFPECLEVTAKTDNGLIMGLRHKEYPLEGIQFHPESIMTKFGKDLLKNFLNWGID
jgi:anthranilate synthase/aminodeoxychorismate synthase-like glutamine amidotransferase